MNPAQAERLATILRTKQAELSNSLHQRDEIVIEKSSDAIDEVQSMGERELAIRNLDRDSRLLRQIRGALARIANGGYGVCLNCEEDILPKRLSALPWAAYCIGCQERIDSHAIEVEEPLEAEAVWA